MVKHKKKRNIKKRLRKAAKRTRKAVDAGVRIWRAVNTKGNRKALGSAGKRANTVSRNIMDML
jgi:hypothetical protein